MIFQNVKTKGVKRKFKELEEAMTKLGFVRWSWDYEKVTYDQKLHADGVDYYLRLRATVVGPKLLEHPEAVLELGTPVFARHFFPHGLDDSVEVPDALKETIDEKLAELEKTFT
jgi:hypothetical protein